MSTWKYKPEFIISPVDSNYICNKRSKKSHTPCACAELDFGRRGFILLAAPDRDSPEKGLSAYIVGIIS